MLRPLQVLGINILGKRLNECAGQFVVDVPDDRANPEANESSHDSLSACPPRSKQVHVSLGPAGVKICIKLRFRLCLL